RDRWRAEVAGPAAPFCSGDDLREAARDDGRCGLDLRCDEIRPQEHHAAVLVRVGVDAEPLRRALLAGEHVAPRRAGDDGEPGHMDHPATVCVVEELPRLIEGAIVRWPSV